ncbi:MAG: extracellular solute-binding protein [Candidatus Omnitrophica bacterium]|nr:extracellular solute-binding protein [Candidatus Omnitrophota bacterium]
MRRYLLAGIIFMVSVSFLGQTSYAQGQTEEPVGRISISGAWALYPMAVKWAEEFQKVYPGVKIDISAGGAGKGITDALSKVVDLGMVSREINPQEVQKGIWSVSVTKDAVVATINANNPSLKDILAKGITKETFKDIFVTGKIKTWGQALKTDASGVINVYTRSDACGAAETWAKYLGTKQEELMGIGVYGDPGVAEAVKSDLLAIGFNNINFAYDSKTKAQVEGIRVVPIDVNGDGLIKLDENVYKDLDTMTAAIAQGRYPSPPARELYMVSNGKPEKKEVLLFLKWVLSDGQKYVPQTGFIKVSEERIKEDLQKLKGN